MKDDMKKVYDKIAKLLAMAEREKGNEKEAAVAAKMAEKLLRKYNLSMKDITPAEAKSNVRELRASDLKWTSGKTPVWVNRLAIAIATACDSMVILRTSADQDAHVAKKQCNLVFVGAELDIKVANEMFIYLYNTILRCTTEHFKHNIPPRGKARTYNNSYRGGMADRLAERLKEMTKEKDEEYKAAGTAMVVVKKEAIENHLVKEGYAPKYGKGNRQQSGNRDAYSAGYSKGGSVNLNKQIK